LEEINKEKDVPRWCNLGRLFHDPHWVAVRRKSPASAFGFRGVFFIDKRLEISNQSLIRDMTEIIKLEEVLSLIM
jgi:hypothetical protein